MRNRSSRFLITCAFTIVLTAMPALAKPANDDPGIGSRIAAAVRHLIRALGDDMSVPHP